ncbi:MAG: hypothetical protein KTR26_03405 [Flammeovirgaceae bacterium]|nr:hypothetical protein [Flammeovirgaceae bacterium]
MNKTPQYILPSGVSGFLRESENTIIQFDHQLFVKSCETVGSKIENFQFSHLDLFKNDLNKSYLYAYYKRENTADLIISCNKYFPIVAFSEVLDEENDPSENPFPDNQFCDLISLHSVFECNFQILDKAYLTTKVDADDEENSKKVSQLTNYEFSEFSYWQPQIIGDILFNDWEKNPA